MIPTRALTYAYCIERFENHFDRCATQLGKNHVLSHGQVERLIEAAPNRTQRVVFMACYGSGLRVSEACTLEIGDIDSARMVMRVRKAKRRRERETVLSVRLLNELRAYYRWRRPASDGSSAGPPTHRRVDSDSCRTR